MNPSMLLLSLALALPIAAQGELYCVVQYHGPGPTDVSRIREMIRRTEVLDLARKTLGDAVPADATIEATAYVNTDGGKIGKPTTLNDKDDFTIGFSLDKQPTLPEALRDEVMRVVVHHLEQRLDSALRVEPMAREERRLEILEKEAAELEDRYLGLRQRAAVLPAAAAQTASAIAADLEKQLLNVELDLRTEEAVQKHLQKQLAEMRTRNDELRSELHALGTKKGRLQVAMAEMRQMLAGTKPEETERARQQLADLENEFNTADTRIQALGDEARQARERMGAVDDDLRKSTTTINRLGPRLRLLQGMAQEQQKKIAAGEDAAAQRDAALTRAEDVKARMQALRQRADEIRVGIAGTERVRLEIWK